MKTHSTHPYDFYAYKSDDDICPECGSKPRDYHVKKSHPAVNHPVIFECAFGHQWQKRTETMYLCLSCSGDGCEHCHDGLMTAQESQDYADAIVGREAD